MREAWARLISVKKIIALLITIAFLWLSVVDKYFSPQEFIGIFTFIIGYYFGQSTVKEHRV